LINLPTIQDIDLTLFSRMLKLLSYYTFELIDGFFDGFDVINDENDN
jgi:hypothetical protein